MQRILIIGKNSYIGTSIEEWLLTSPNEYLVDTLDVQSKGWNGTSFSSYDVVIHVAGIAHIKETKKNASLFYLVNTDIVKTVALKAKAEGVSLFIFLSSISVYGKEKGKIQIRELPKPRTHYGKSKLEAEKQLQAMEDSSFSVAILRTPMVYGKKCKGNYQKLRSLVLRYHVFPKKKNQRSMIYIGNLTRYVERLILERGNGLFFPQNPDYVCTYDMVAEICKRNHTKLFGSTLLNLLTILPVSSVRKAFGDLIYCEIDQWSRQGIPFEQTMIETEGTER